MKALNVPPGLWLRNDQDPRGYAIVTKRSNTPRHVLLEFDNQVTVEYEPDTDLEPYRVTTTDLGAELLAVQAQVQVMLVTLSQVRDDLTGLTEGVVDAPNVWRWTVQRALKRIEAYSGALARHEQSTGPEVPVQPSQPA